MRTDGSFQELSRALLFGLLFFSFVWCHQHEYRFATPVSRLDLLHAVIQHGSLSIDRYHTNTPDKALFEGHYFSDKAPGTVALAVGPFALSAYGLKAFAVKLDSESGWLVSSWFTCAVTLAAPAALGFIALFAWLCQHAPARSALLTVLTLAVGSMPIAYATALWSHTLVVGLIAGSVWALNLFGADKGPSRATLAGLCIGLAVASEYTAAPVAIALTVYAIGRHHAHGLTVLAASLPPLLLIPAYSWATVGTPFDLPYSFQASFPQMRRGLYAIEWPDLETLGRLLLSPKRGLFFWSPFLLVSFWGAWRMAHTSPQRLWLTCALPAVMALALSGRVWDWEAGYCLGPRYLTPILPLLSLPCALGAARWPKPAVALAGLSITITTAGVLTNCVFPKRYENPLLECVAPSILKGVFSPNLGTVLGLSPSVSVALFYGLFLSGTVCLWRIVGKHEQAILITGPAEVGKPPLKPPFEGAHGGPACHTRI